MQSTDFDPALLHTSWQVAFKLSRQETWVPIGTELEHEALSAIPHSANYRLSLRYGGNGQAGLTNDIIQQNFRVQAHTVKICEYFKSRGLGISEKNNGFHTTGSVWEEPFKQGLASIDIYVTELNDENNLRLKPLKSISYSYNMAANILPNPSSYGVITSHHGSYPSGNEQMDPGS